MIYFFPPLICTKQILGLSNSLTIVCFALNCRTKKEENLLRKTSGTSRAIVDSDFRQRCGSSYNYYNNNNSKATSHSCVARSLNLFSTSSSYISHHQPRAPPPSQPHRSPCLRLFAGLGATAERAPSSPPRHTHEDAPRTITSTTHAHRPRTTARPGAARQQIVVARSSWWLSDDGRS